jgi:hypothetical protein
MAEEERRWGKPAGGKSALTVAAVLVLLGAVAWLVSERNARHYALVYEDGLLSVKKGLLFPVGAQTFKTSDPALAEAYAPIKPPEGAKLDEEQTFDDRAGLDQGLYELLARWARDDIGTERPEMVERALTWIGRAEKLQQISAAQRADLANLRAESGFFEARQLLEKSAEGLRQARERLRLTAGSASPHAGDAGEALRRLDPLVDEVYQTGRLLATNPGRTPEAPPSAPPPAASDGGRP